MERSRGLLPEAFGSERSGGGSCPSRKSKPGTAGGFLEAVGVVNIYSLVIFIFYIGAVFYVKSCVFLRFDLSILCRLFFVVYFAVASNISGINVTRLSKEQLFCKIHANSRTRHPRKIPESRKQYSISIIQYNSIYIRK